MLSANGAKNGRSAVKPRPHKQWKWGVSWPTLLALAGGVFLPMLGAEAGNASILIATKWAAILCWVFVPIWWPYDILQLGTLGHGSRKVSKSDEPVRFWVGVATFECVFLFLSFWACLFLLASLGIHVSLR